MTQLPDAQAVISWDLHLMGSTPSWKLFAALKRRCVGVRRALGPLATRLQKEGNKDTDKKKKNGGKGDGEKTKNTKHKHVTEVGRQVQQKEDGPNLESVSHQPSVEDMEAVVVLALVALTTRYHSPTDEDWRIGVFG